MPGLPGYRLPVRAENSATWADAPDVRWRLGSVLSGALLAGGGLPGRAMIFGLQA
jgi:hypothetical protein